MNLKPSFSYIIPLFLICSLLEKEKWATPNKCKVAKFRKVTTLAPSKTKDHFITKCICN